MNNLCNKTVCTVSALLVLFLAIVFAAHAQPAGRGAEGAAQAQQPQSRAAIDAERAQIWNSPNMLRARAWLQDYCSKSAKVTPAEGQKYMQELENMSPTQMKLWLLKFDEQEERRQQQYSMWQQSHSAGISSAMAANKATQQAYANINQAETAAAEQEQQQINVQQQDTQEMEEAKQAETVGPYPAYGYAPGYGGVHYHFHLYPYEY